MPPRHSRRAASSHRKLRSIESGLLLSRQHRKRKMRKAARASKSEKKPTLPPKHPRKSPAFGSFCKSTMPPNRSKSSPSGSDPPSTVKYRRSARETTSPDSNMHQAHSSVPDPTPSLTSGMSTTQPQSHFPVQPQFAYIALHAPMQSQQPPVYYYYVQKPVALNSQSIPCPVHVCPPTDLSRAHSDSLEQQRAALSHDLNRIQQEILTKEAEVTSKPHDAALRLDVDNLKSQLNSALDNATAIQRTRRSRDPEPPTPRLQNPTDTCQRERQSTSVTVAHLETDQQGGKPSLRHASGASPLKWQQRNCESERKMNHFCRSCGVVRSAEYHGKHPLEPGQKPALNYCSVCLDKKLEAGDTGRYHFCHDCGKVRSRAFHNDHPMLQGTVFINYCGKCLASRASIEHVPEASTVVGCYPLTGKRKAIVIDW